MARGRMLSQTVATDKKLNSLSIEAELLYLKAIPHLDRDGLILGDPTLLWAKVCPRRPELMVKTEAIVQELIDSEIVVAYMDDDEQILFFPGFAKNQANMRYEREPASVFPPPPGYQRTPKGLEPVAAVNDDEKSENTREPHVSGKHPANIRQNDGCLPSEEKRREEKRKGVRQHSAAAAPPSKSAGSGGGALLKPSPEYAEVCSAIEQNGFGMLTPIVADQVLALLVDYPKDWILDAMKVSVTQNKRKLSYAVGILRKWRADGRDSPKAAVDTATGSWQNFNKDLPDYMKELAQ